MTVRINGSTGFTNGDNVKLKLGASDDLQIYHDGSNSYIKDTGTGNLFIQAADYVILGNPSNEQAIACLSNGTVSIKYDNAEKIATTSTGVNVTGTVTSDGLTVDGSSSIDHLRLNDGYLRFYNATSQTPAGAAIYRPSGTADLNIMTGTVDRAKFANGGDISFYEDTGTTAEFFWDASAERLGIGTTSPAQKLTVYDGMLLLEQSAASNNLIRFTENSSESFHLGVDASANFHITGPSFTNDKYLTVDTSGNVGIGTTDPSSPLDVKGRFTISDSDASWNHLVGRTAYTASTSSTDIFKLSVVSLNSSEITIVYRDTTYAGGSFIQKIYLSSVGSGNATNNPTIVVENKNRKNTGTWTDYFTWAVSLDGWDVKFSATATVASGDGYIFVKAEGPALGALTFY